MFGGLLNPAFFVLLHPLLTVLQAEYVYDGASDRLQQVDYTGVTPITTTYTNDSFGLTQALVADDGTTQVYNLFGLDLISQDSRAEVRTLLVDGLGSVRLEMVGSVVETTTTYTPYGELLDQAGMSGTTYGFTGEQEDGATGLLYLRARYYNRALKIFQSRDPWEGSGWRPGTLNYYVYVASNPINHSDPTGHYVCRKPNDCDPLPLARIASTDPRNLTPWIVAEANYLPTLPEGERIALGLEPAPYSPSAKCVVCSAHSFNEIVKDGAPLDVKDHIFEELGDTIQLGGVWFEYSTPGNILFGYYGSAWGFAPTELHGGAGIAQLLDYCRDRETPLGPVSLLFDTVDDYYAIEFGIKLYYEAYATDRVVTISEFTSLLVTYENLSKMALRSAPLSDRSNPNWPYWQGYFYNDENVPESESWFPSFQELR